jgi:hypothetical protein
VGTPLQSTVDPSALNDQPSISVTPFLARYSE